MHNHKTRPGSPTHLLLLRKLRLPNLIAPQDNIQHPLHGPEQLLIRRRRPALKVRDDRRRSIALGREILLRHRGAFVVLGLGPRLGDRLADLGADRLGFHDVVGAVDFCEALAFGGGALEAESKVSGM